MTRRNIESYDDASVAAVIGQYVGALLQMPSGAKAIADMCSCIERGVSLQSQVIERVAERSEASLRVLEGLCNRQDVLEHASRQQSMLTDDHYVLHVIEPLAHAVLQIIDVIRDACSSGEYAEADLRLAAVIEIQLCELLSRYGMEAMISTEGTSFDPRTMRPAGTRTTQCKQLHRTVARVLRIGLRRDTKMLRHESVEIYENGNSNSNGG